MSRSKQLFALACLVSVIGLAVAWSSTAASADTVRMPQQLHLQIISTRPHDTSAFTQGLLLHEGELYESTGEFGKSTLRRVDPLTGNVRQRIDMAPDIFAEGLARVDDRLIQLTWKNRVAFVYDLRTFAKLDEYTYGSEGWGLCYDGESLYMSDGTSTLFIRDPDTFVVTRKFEVTQGNPVTGLAHPRDHLNELECVGDEIYANIWTTDEIVRIDKATGQVLAVIDASDLLTREERAQTDVLNGIAWDPDAQTFLITGKWWPWLYEVRFVGEPVLLPMTIANLRLRK